MVKYGRKLWAHGSVVERQTDNLKVLGSIPSAPTRTLFDDAIKLRLIGTSFLS